MVVTLENAQMKTRKIASARFVSLSLLKILHSNTTYESS